MIVCDVGDGEMPDLNAQPFAASSSALIVVVRHAQDVETDGLDALAPDEPVPQAQVAVEVVIVPEPVDAADFQCELVVTTGMIDIGDADHWDTMHLPSGTWLAQVVVIPADAPDHVEIVFTPTSAVAP